MMNLKTHLLILAMLLLTVAGFSQTVVPSGSPSQVTDFKGGVKVEKTLNLPVTDAEPFPGQDKLGQVRISPTDSIVRYFNGVDWVKVTTEENDYATRNNLADSISSARQFALDKDTLRVPYAGATKNVNLGEGHALIAHFIGAGYTGVSLASEVPAWLAVKNPVIPAAGATQTVFGVYNSTGVRSLYVFSDENDIQYFNNRGAGNQASNSAMGNYALSKNTTGTYINAYGYGALQENTTGILNLAIGYGSLNKNTTGTRNLAIGSYSLVNTTTGSFNTAVGAQNLLALTTGKANTVIGQGVASSITEGNYNTIIGRHWGGSDTTAANRFLSGNYNTVISPGVDETDAVGINFSNGSYNTFIGNVKNIGNNTNNAIIIADGQNNRAFQKLDISGTNDFSGGNIRLNGLNVAMDNTVVHSSGNETITGTKYFDADTDYTPIDIDISDATTTSPAIKVNCNYLSSRAAFNVHALGGAFPVLQLSSDSKINFGNGSATPDISIAKTGTGLLTITTGTLILSNALNVTGNTTLRNIITPGVGTHDIGTSSNYFDEIFLNSIYTASIRGRATNDVQFTNTSGAVRATFFGANGNWNFGTSLTDPGVKASFDGTLRVTTTPTANTTNTEWLTRNTSTGNFESTLPGYALTTGLSVAVSSATPGTTQTIVTNLSRIYGNLLSLKAYAAKTANYTLAITDDVIDFTGTTTATATLPTAASIAGEKLFIMNSGTGAITMATTSSQTIGGNAAAGYTLSQGGVLIVASDGANWKVLSYYNPSAKSGSLNISSSTTLIASQFGPNGQLDVYVNATSAAVTLTLPAVAVMAGYQVNVIKTDSSTNAVSIQGDSGVNINQSNIYSLPSQNANVTIKSNATQYWAF